MTLEYLPKRDIGERTRQFGISVILLTKILPKTPAGFAISQQVVRSGTSVGANIQEAQDGLSRKDFLHSMNISLKEAKETYYWLTTIRDSKLLPEGAVEKVIAENLELIKILITIVKNTKKG